MINKYRQVMLILLLLSHTGFLCHSIFVKNKKRLYLTKGFMAVRFQWRQTATTGQQNITSEPLGKRNDCDGWPGSTLQSVLCSIHWALKHRGRWKAELCRNQSRESSKGSADNWISTVTISHHRDTVVTPACFFPHWWSLFWFGPSWDDRR